MPGGSGARWRRELEDTYGDPEEVAATRALRKAAADADLQKALAKRAAKQVATVAYRRFNSGGQEQICEKGASEVTELLGEAGNPPTPSGECTETRNPKTSSALRPMHAGFPSPTEALNRDLGSLSPFSGEPPSKILLGPRNFISRPGLGCTGLWFRI